MNFRKVTTSNGRVLVNFDNVTGVHARRTGGCEIYFNTSIGTEGQAVIHVEELLGEVLDIINNGEQK
jgi:hypothetical protein